MKYILPYDLLPLTAQPARRLLSLGFVFRPHFLALYLLSQAASNVVDINRWKNGEVVQYFKSTLIFLVQNVVFAMHLKIFLKN